MTETRESMEHFLTLNSPWFEYVRDGIKTYEGRSCKNGKVKKYKIGDIITISHHTDFNQKEYQVKILDILFYPDFRFALEILGLEKTLPGTKTIDEGETIYFKYVSKETQFEYGVCMINVQRI